MTITALVSILWLVVGNLLARRLVTKSGPETMIQMTVFTLLWPIPTTLLLIVSGPTEFMKMLIGKRKKKRKSKKKGS